LQSREGKLKHCALLGESEWQYTYITEIVELNVSLDTPATLRVRFKCNDFPFITDSMREENREQSLVTPYIVDSQVLPLHVRQELFLRIPFMHSRDQRRQPPHSALTFKPTRGAVLGGVNKPIDEGGTIYKPNDLALDRHGSNLH